MFTNVSDRIARNPPALHCGIAVTDVDGDGADEAFVAGFGGPNRVLKWVGGYLRDVAPRVLADPHRQALGVAAGDVNGDGREELIVLNVDMPTGPTRHADRLFVSLPDGHWEDLFSQPANRGVRNLSAGRSVAVLDRRGTGRYGFFIANYGRPMRLYELSPDGRLVDLAPSLGLDRTAGGRGLWAGPLVSDRPDLLCVNDQGPNFLYRNVGDGRFAELAVAAGLADELESARGVTVLDADADGRLDVCYGNWEGPHRLMVRKPDGSFRDRASPAMAMPGRVRTVVAADFDNDGYEELFFNCVGEPNRLFGFRDGEWRLLDAGEASDPFGLGTGATVADFDSDGRLELLVACGETTGQPLRLFQAPPNDHGWLRVRPQTRFGAPARGAIVRLTAGGRTQIRVIDGGSGYLCQMEPVAHFGLGRTSIVESVIVIWPDGVRRAVTEPLVGSTIYVPYPSE